MERKTTQLQKQYAYNNNNVHTHTHTHTYVHTHTRLQPTDQSINQCFILCLFTLMWCYTHTHIKHTHTHTKLYKLAYRTMNNQFNNRIDNISIRQNISYVIASIKVNNQQKDTQSTGAEGDWQERRRTWSSYSFSLRLAVSLRIRSPMYSMTMVCFSRSLAAYRPKPCKTQSLGFT